MSTDRVAAPAYQDLADRLREQILAGDLKPGDRLPVEPDLCTMYGVSRSTVREALRVLSSERLLVTRRGVAGGSFVTRPEPEHISSYLQSSLALFRDAGSVANLLEVRVLLEVPTAGLAAVRRTPEQLEALRGALFDPRAIERERLYAANRRFHKALLEAANNPLLDAVTAPVFGVLENDFVRDDVADGFWDRVDKDHREILAYVEAGDSHGAERAQREHLEHLRSVYRRIGKERPAGG
ncbi:GntR family transcriptional regulator [Sphaerisporangium siamense]|uniref:DNA-binding FadR family transcriptional regulator n=1 Tax=Sphaerisporangium siamense TaxID=795645 RepID=A0A7W7DCW7_9ACTN|nr:FadR/GntR family transcriptional regulator [Sphaerisporangium siamense]MBB4704520.1 DNA-binding FadR family transcriptional regulator [Sphaerisporangium siamense]GII86132.1 GntR family transcriptional regulator [Sphaerisporangium siamense]